MDQGNKRCSRSLRFTMTIASLCSVNVANSDVLNIDFEAQELNFITHVGDDGILSNTGGTVWNGMVFFRENLTNLMNENGNLTGALIRIEFLVPFNNDPGDPAATNNLQDDGTTGEGFRIVNLVPNTRYDLAVYAAQNTGFALTGFNNGQFVECSSDAPTYALPGAAGKDYCLFTNLPAQDIGGNEIGFELSSLDGLITGIQISGDLGGGTPPLGACDPNHTRALRGTANADVLIGTDGIDHIFGMGGDDRIEGRGGNDCIDGGDGADILFGDAGIDLLIGGEGDDTLRGNADGDVLDGGPGNDLILGDDPEPALQGNDDIKGGPGDDVIFGFGGDDTLEGGPGQNFIYGDDGNDILNGGDRNDFLIGGRGDDTLNGGPQHDSIIGGSGDDQLDGGDGIDLLFGGAGQDACVNGETNTDCE